ANDNALDSKSLCGLFGRDRRPFAERFDLAHQGIISRFRFAEFFDRLAKMVILGPQFVLQEIPVPAAGKREQDEAHQNATASCPHTSSSSRRLIHELRRICTKRKKDPLLFSLPLVSFFVSIRVNSWIKRLTSVLAAASVGGGGRCLR